jgi:mono/diheme cytochrome c family protein
MATCLQPLVNPAVRRHRAAWILGSLLVAGSLAEAHADPVPAPGPAAAAQRGRRLFATYCVVCHGAEADGNGRAAALYTPRPANLRTSDKSDTYLGLIVRRGGAALGRSPTMPAWGAELGDARVDDLVAFLRSVNARP